MYVFFHKSSSAENYISYIWFNKSEMSFLLRISETSPLGKIKSLFSIKLKLSFAWSFSPQNQIWGEELCDFKVKWGSCLAWNSISNLFCPQVEIRINFGSASERINFHYKIKWDTSCGWKIVSCLAEIRFVFMSKWDFIFGKLQSHFIFRAGNLPNTLLKTTQR